MELSLSHSPDNVSQIVGGPSPHLRLNHVTLLAGAPLDLTLSDGLPLSLVPPERGVRASLSAVFSLLLPSPSPFSRAKASFPRFLWPEKGAEEEQTGRQMTMAAINGYTEGLLRLQPAGKAIGESSTLAGLDDGKSPTPSQAPILLGEKRGKAGKDGIPARFASLCGVRSFAGFLPRPRLLLARRVPLSPLDERRRVDDEREGGEVLLEEVSFFFRAEEMSAEGRGARAEGPFLLRRLGESLRGKHALSTTRNAFHTRRGRAEQSFALA